jgi:hypothetical protein
MARTVPDSPASVTSGRFVLSRLEIVSPERERQPAPHGLGV